MYVWSRKRTDSRQNAVPLRLWAAVLIAAYGAAVLLFYWLAGEQLHLRASRSNRDLPQADSGTVELTAGCTVEQYFTTRIQRLEQIDIQWSAYYRSNAGCIQVELLDLRTGQVLLSRTFDASAVPEGGFTTLTADTPLENIYEAPLLLRLTADSQPGGGASPLMNVQSGPEDWSLVLNGVPAPGTLCMALSGTDYIWTGLHYWKFAGLGLALLLLFLAVVYLRWRSGKRSCAVSVVEAMQKYQFLIRQLVARDFKTKYKRSILGVLWSFLNPLLLMCVQYFVFSNLFQSDIPNYAVYLILGIVFFNFFSEACGMSLTSIVGNANLITKVYVPKYIYPLTKVISSVVNLGISLIPLLIVVLATGVELRKSAVLAFYFLFCLMLFSLGVGLLLAASMVFFRDTQFLWGVLTMIWMYATPIFYPESILADKFKVILQVNPLYHFLKNFRICILDGVSPEPVVYAQCALIALTMLLVGTFVFHRFQDRFVLYL